jgi:hypothetical protein
MTRTAIRRLPFTALTLAAFVAAALASRSVVEPLDDALMQRFGFAPADVIAAELWRAITSVFLTSGGAAFWSGLIMIALVVGAAEWFLGTRRAALTFWGAHLVTLLAMLAIAAPLAEGGGIASLLYSVRDVGPSAGYVGCLAALAVAAPAAWRRLLVPAAALALAGALALTLASEPLVPAALSADVAHLTAFVVTATVLLGLSRRPARAQ